MELQFRETQLRCLRCSASDIQNTEQTLELRLPENMPPVGRVLGAWGQCLLRGKEWRGDHVSATGGVMVQALYESEDAGGVHCVQGWIPFQLRWELTDSQKDGTVVISCLLRSVDARQIGAEKLLLRASVSAAAQAMEEESYPLWKPDSLPEELQLLEKQYAPCVAVEAGEKALSLDEELVLPPGQVDMSQLLFYQLTPTVKEQKIMADKMVFRGTAALHTVYLGEDGMLHAFDIELPISQFDQLREEYGEDATLWVAPAVTDLELQRLDGGRMHLKADLLGQYVVYDTVALSVVEDAYCPGSAVELQRETVPFPAVKRGAVESYTASVTVDGEPVKVTASVSQPRVFNDVAEMEGAVECLYYDSESRPQWESKPFSAAVHQEGKNTRAWVNGPPECKVAPDGTALLEGQMQLWTMDREGISMVSGLKLEERRPDPDRPSLILRRAGGLSLWELAKKCGSTVASIQEANGLQEEPKPEQMLIIPVL